MAVPTQTLPTVGELNQNADPKVYNCLQELQTILNGAIDATNLVDGAVTGGKLAVNAYPGGNYTNSGAIAIGDASSNVVPATVLNCRVATNGHVLLAATIGYRNNTAATQTPTPTFARYGALNGPVNTVTGWTRLGSFGGYNTVASGTSHAGNGPVLMLSGSYVDSPAAGDYTYAVWWDTTTANNSDPLWMAGIAPCFSAVVTR